LKSARWCNADRQRISCRHHADGLSPINPRGLVASHLHLRRVENPRSRNLRCDQECRNNGRHAYQSEKLIHRKHLSSPQDDIKSQTQKACSIRPLRGLLIPCQKLVRVSCPGNREQRQNRNYGQCLHAVIVVFECGQKCQSLAHFRDEQEKHRGGVPPCSTAKGACKPAGVVRPNYMALIR
jgi:hypothetical protein